MTRRSDITSRRRRATRRRSPARAAVVVAAALALVAGAGLPAAAVHQNCSGSYAEGSLPSGHPDMDVASGERGWSGSREYYQLEAALFAVEAAQGTINGVSDIIEKAVAIIHAQADFHHDSLVGPLTHHIIAAALRIAETAGDGVSSALTWAGIALDITITGLGVARIEAGSDTPDACGDVILGDAVDQLWVALVQRNLASSGPPLAMLLLPSEHGSSSQPWPLMPQHRDSDFGWCPPISLPDAIPPPAGHGGHGGGIPDTGGSCSPEYHTGFLDAPNVGVADIVAVAVAHSLAHDVDVRDAESCLAVAQSLQSAGEYREAFNHYRLAYQMATGVDHVEGGC